MANIENLQKLTTEKAREIGSKGGKRSGEVKRARKTLKEELLLLLSENKIQETISLSLIKEAMKGNNSGSVTKAFEVIRDTIGEKPKEQHEIGNIDDKPFEVDLKHFTLDQLKELIKNEDKE